MVQLFNNWLKKNWNGATLVFVLILIIINSVLIIINRNIIRENVEITNRVLPIDEGLNKIDQNIKFAEIGSRAFMLIQDEKFLGPYTTALTWYQKQLTDLEILLDAEGYDISEMVVVRKAVEGYMNTIILMVDLSRNGKKDEALEIFRSNPGSSAWQTYAPIVDKGIAFTKALKTKANQKISRSVSVILYLQLFLLLLGVPVIILAILRISKSEKFRSKLFKRLLLSNRKYVYNEGVDMEIDQEEEIIQSLVDNLKHATKFISQITQGNYSIKWEGLNEKNESANQSNIAGELIKMRDQMKTVKEKDDIRIWKTEGMSKFGDIVRKYQNQFDELANKIISNIVKYMKVVQGGLFILEEEADGTKYLDLKGFYAYERLKAINKRVDLGQGLVGQCYLEGETTYMPQVPEKYISITSGLGDANPQSILLVPLKSDGVVEGVIELASLRKFQPHEIEFIENLGATIASAIISIRTNEKTQRLLEESQQQTEEMRAQEEEMRQNMEELQATQEQMERKNKEVEALLNQASENEEELKVQLETIEELTRDQERASKEVLENAEAYRTMLMEILNEIPQKVFLKDKEGAMVLANQLVADAHGLSLDELIGKSDFDFVDETTAQEWREQELVIMKKGEEKYVFEEKLGGKSKMLESIKKAFFIKPLDQYGLLGIQTDITELEQLKNQLKLLKESGK